MARITVEDCMTKINNQYDLVLLAKERTAQLNAGIQMLVPEDNDKKTIISLREIGEGKVLVDDLKKSAVLRLRKEPDENLQQEVAEEDENDESEHGLMITSLSWQSHHLNSLEGRCRLANRRAIVRRRRQS